MGCIYTENQGGVGKRGERECVCVGGKGRKGTVYVSGG